MKLKLLTKRIISLILVIVFVTLLVLPNLSFYHRLPAIETNLTVNAFTNEFFNTNISTSDSAEELIEYSQINNIILDELGKTYANQLLRDQATVNRLNNLIGNKRIAIYSAEDLYNLSIDASYHGHREPSHLNEPYELTIELLLSQNYVLLNDIDYSSQRSKQFIPLGINITLPQEIPKLYYLPFTGTFDGQGYTIYKLYISNTDAITTPFRFDIDDVSTEEIIPLFQYYSFITELSPTGKVKNLNIKDPIWELLDAPEGLENTSIMVGLNKGLIYNSSIIDERVNNVGTNISGIIFNIQFQSTALTNYQAAGFVHTNASTGKIYNSFYVSNNVIVQGSRTHFDVKPFVYTNEANGDIRGCAYHQALEAAVDSLEQPGGVQSYTTLELETGKTTIDGIAESINVNTVNLSAVTFNGQLLNEDKVWTFYEKDGFPNLFKLEYDAAGFFKIETDYDFVVFSRLISYRTEFLGKTYDRHEYRIMNNIDMKNIRGYATPSVEFRGILSGGTGDLQDSNPNKTISNLSINVPHVTTNDYFLGLTSSLSSSAIIRNLNFYNNPVNNRKVFVDNINEYYGKTFYIGTVTGQLNGGLIENIITNVNIDLGGDALSTSYVGGVAGSASGTIRNVANLGLIDGGNHTFGTQAIDANFCIGGIVGSGSNLKLNNALNKGNINGLASTNPVVVGSGNNANIKVGGIIGQINNEATNNNQIYYVTNSGKISSGAFQGSASSVVHHYIGGIFGDAIGQGSIISQDGETFVNGRWENDGVIGGTYTDTYNKYYLAGIGVASTTESKAEFSYMINKKGYEFSDFNLGTHNSYVYYASTMIDNSSGGIKLSRAYNTYDYTYSTSYFTNSKNLPLSTVVIAPFFTTITDQPSEMIYSHNQGNIFVGSTSSNISLSPELRIAGITNATKVDYKNVISSSKIEVLRINNANSIYVAGIAWILPFDTSDNKAYRADNVMFEGEIATANILGNTTISSATADGSSGTSFTSSLSIANLYAAGLFNINVGIINNSLNRAKISSNSDYAGIADIDGFANVYAGGLVTFNYNLISASANTGLIEYTNSNTTVTADSGANMRMKVAGGTTPAYDSMFGGLIFAIKGGLTLGGVASAFGDNNALILNGYGRGNSSLVAKIIDSSNNGDVYGKAYYYVRAGGILGVALGTELASGTSGNLSSSSASNPNVTTFVTAIAGAGDKIANAELSNGLNFGNVTAVTKVIGIYNGTVSGTTNQGNNYANSQRPGIYACAGGVIGYGLCIMTKMLNHGIISSTDVAGGIVGATYILGGSNASIAITTVDIDTAVHYGKVKAAQLAAYDNFTYALSKNVNNTTYFYPDNNTFIFPSSSHNLALYPNLRRGFGGIFGRLQRGSYGLMQSNNFVNIMNMDENIDMVGRADQSTYGSYFYFRFSSQTRPDTYYTARPNDTTPVALVGYTSGTRRTTPTFTNYTAQVSVQRSGSRPNYTYRVTRVNITSGSGTEVSTITRNVGQYLDVQQLSYNQLNSAVNTLTLTSTAPFTNRSQNFTSGLSTYDNYGITQADLDTFTSNTTRTFTKTNITYPMTGSTSSSSTSLAPHQIERITDDESISSRTYIFDESFPLMDEEQSNYIYPVNNDALADRFRLAQIDGATNPSYKKNGMYVLATKDGREVGAVLPANLNITNLYKLDENNAEYIDLDNVSLADLIVESDSSPLMIEYKSMFQIRLNERSSILEKKDQIGIADLVLYDPLKNSPVLSGGVLNGNTITFIMSRDAFTNYNVNYQVQSAELSERAVIAKHDLTNGDFAILNAAYDARTSNILDGDLVATLSGTVVPGQKLIFNTPLTVYAEISTQIEGLTEIYRTEYTIEIVCSNTPFAINLTSIIMDGTSASVPSLINNKYTISSPKLNPDGKIRLNFSDPSNQLALNHEMNFIGLYRGSDKIKDEYFDYVIEPKNASNQFALELTLSDELMAGTYQIRYRYYENTTEYTVEFDKMVSTDYSIRSVDYLTYSSDASGDSTSFVPTDDAFNTYIGFGIILDGILKEDTSGISIHRIENDELDDYVDKMLYYEIRINGNLIETIKIAPFAELVDVVAYYSYVQGIKHYTFEYYLKSEAILHQEINNNTELDPLEIDHDIIERLLPEFIVYLNGNRVFEDEVSVARESMKSYVYIDFGFPNSESNLDVTTSITKDGANYEPLDGQIEFNAYTYYEIIIDYELEIGPKLYTFHLLREEGVELSLGELIIIKELGINAYLQDIFFQKGTDTRFSYPNMYEVDEDGVKIEDSDYDIHLYYDGIDYDNADVMGVKYFRIDGLVSEVDLEYYSPDFILPAGASIYRYDEENNLWTTELESNFFGDDSEFPPAIKYKIVSQDENDTVYYYITAVDILYNLTIRFNIYWQFSDGTIVLASDQSSPIKSNAIVITVRNYALKDKDENGQTIIYEKEVMGNHIIYPYEDSIKDYVEGMNNQSTMFYYPVTNTNYLYTFARNFSGAYSFTVTTPIYRDDSTNELIKNERYTYSIFSKFGTIETDIDPTPWNHEDYLLPVFDEAGEYSGSYFFIESSLKNRIRVFAIVIHESTMTTPWGLYDYNTSWDN